MPFLDASITQASARDRVSSDFAPAIELDG
jgi:hypothetical protein